MNLLVQLLFLMPRQFKAFPQPCSWGICWAFGSSQGLIWRITPFKRSIGIIPHINTQPHSKTVLSFIWNILQLKTWILSGRLSQNISWTDPFQCFVFLFGHSSKGSLYLSNGISAFSLYHFSQSLAISSSNMSLCIFCPIYFEFSSQHCLRPKQLSCLVPVLHGVDLG